MSASIVLLHLIGAVALLLWGMRMVRTGVSRACGARLRQALQYSVRSRVRALAVGLGVTAVLQSATATALMVASFAGRGLIATGAALAVMLGADAGTTLVAQALSLRVDWLSPTLIAVGVSLHYVTEAALARQIGRACTGLGLMLLALHLIVTVSEPLRESAILHEVLGALGGERVIGMLIAVLLTVLTHSSLAVVLLIMSLAEAGVASLPLAFALIVGANIGGAVPAVLATWSSGPAARRVTLGNLCFKVSACLLVLPFLGEIQPLVAWLESDPARQAVNFHTALNLAIALVFIGVTEPCARLLARLLPAAPAAEEPGVPRYLDRDSLDMPTVALANAARETLRMGDVVAGMLQCSLRALKEDDVRYVNEVHAADNAVDRLHEAIKLYVSAVSRNALDDTESRRATEILTFATNLEHIGDIAEDVSDQVGKKISRRMQFSREGLADIEALHARVSNNLSLALATFMSGEIKLARQLLREKRSVNAMERTSAGAHMARLVEGRPESIETSAMHMDILRDLKRIHSHIVAGAYPILAQAGELPANEPDLAQPAAAVNG